MKYQPFVHFCSLWLVAIGTQEQGQTSTTSLTKYQIPNTKFIIHYNTCFSTVPNVHSYPVKTLLLALDAGGWRRLFFCVPRDDVRRQQQQQQHKEYVYTHATVTRYSCCFLQWRGLCSVVSRRAPSLSAALSSSSPLRLGYGYGRRQRRFSRPLATLRTKYKTGTFLIASTVFCLRISRWQPQDQVGEFARD